MARREPRRRTAQRQSLHFSVLKVLGRAAIDTPGSPPTRREWRPCDILPGIPAQESIDSRDGSGAFSSGGQSARLITVRSVVRVHKGPPLHRHCVTDMGM